jgi:hypothetical protein
MNKKERLYEAFGELVYVVAMADGIIQAEEVQVLHNIIESHPWASDIEWSFNYEVTHHPDLEYLYNKVLSICHQNGPDPEYKFLVDLLENIAQVSSSVEAEKKVITKFTYELTERLKNDIDLLNGADQEFD